MTTITTGPTATTLHHAAAWVVQVTGMPAEWGLAVTFGATVIAVSATVCAAGAWLERKDGQGRHTI